MTVVGTVDINGRPHYVVLAHPAQARDIANMAAKEAWLEFYRSVRVLRRLRQRDPGRFRAMSRTYWRSVMRYEDPKFFKYGYDK